MINNQTNLNEKIKLLKRSKYIISGRGENRKLYIPDFGTFDTEWTTISYTENNKPHGVGLLYLWTACIFGDTYAGRTLDEFVDLCLSLKEKLDLGVGGRTLVIYVHNLAADFQFFRSYLPDGDIFAVDKRAIIKYYWEGIEFRCSYKLSNMSLEKFCENENVEHSKIKDFNYKKLRTPDTELTDQEMGYAINDVVGLYECIKSKLEKEEDDIVSIPMTSTGYVRRDCREACRKYKGYRSMFNDQRLTILQYQMLREAFRGGNTHANRYHAGRIIDNICSYDISSSYPSVMLYEKYPMGRFVRVEPKTAEELDAIVDEKHGFLARVRFLNLKTVDPIPYISVSNRIADFGQITYTGNFEDTFIHDNGRILFECGWSTISITNIDWEIIRDHYKFDAIEIDNCYRVRMALLPLPIRQTVSKYFENKTKLKGIEGQEYFYTKSKNMLNAMYGMLVMNPLRDENTIENGEWITHNSEMTQEALDAYYEKKSSFLHYQWGVWITAYARRNLQIAIDICGNKIVYCDTDSVKFIYDKQIIECLNFYNEEIIAKAEECETTAKAYTNNGDLQILGVFEKDGEYDKFITYGAKKYAYEINGKFKFTVSGLGKSAYSEIKNIDNFKLGIIINNSGRTISDYDDNCEPHEIEVEGKTYIIRSNMAILDTTYTLGVTNEYHDLVDAIREDYHITKIDGKKQLIYKASNQYDPE